MVPSLFCDSASITQLAFDLPSKLRSLDLPASHLGNIGIPDSVEFISGAVGRLGRQRRLLEFGRESRLKRISLSRYLGLSAPRLSDNVFFYILSHVGGDFVVNLGTGDHLCL
jgi:hypothetical protein